MLILTRRIGESISIGSDVHIQIQQVRGNQVQIGINAPPEVIVLREEVRKSSRLDREDTLSAAIG